MWRRNSVAAVLVLAIAGVTMASEDMASLSATPISAPSEPPASVPPAASSGKSAHNAMERNALGSMSQSEYLRYRIQLKNQTELNKAQIEALESQQKLEQLQQTVRGGPPAPAPAKDDVPGTYVPKETAYDLLRRLSVYGIFSDGGEFTAEIRSGRGIIPVRVGDTLPGEHVVISINPTDVRVRGADGKESSVPLPAEQQRTNSVMPALFPPPGMGLQ